MDDSDYTDEQIIRILRLISRQDIDSLDALDLSSMTIDQRVRVIRRWLQIKSERELQRRAKLAEWAFLKRHKGDSDKPAEIVRDFLTSQEFILALGVFAATLGVASGLVHLAVAYRQARTMDRQQARILTEYLASKLSGGRRGVAHAENLLPSLRAFANAITPERALEVLDMREDRVRRSIPAFKSEGTAIEAHYRRTLSRIGVSLSDIFVSSEPWALPWTEEGLPPLPGASKKSSTCPHRSIGSQTQHGLLAP
ncbi:MAG: hypothetical protein NXI18_13180 [Alphaproteobacteria bacterium]|nr:hypothetical protein [Alphaproteobacteria bacterium]